MILNLAKSITKAVKELGLTEIEFKVEHPEEMEHGDYACNVALVGFKQAKDKYKSPKELAEAVVVRLKADENLKKMVSEIRVAGSGFINISIKNEVLISQLERLLTERLLIGIDEIDEKEGAEWGKRVMVEYAHPNTHKEFHIGHLRNIILGESISRILEAVGSEIIRTNYQGDVGLHIAKAMWGVVNDKLGYEKAKKADVFTRAKFLGQAYAAGSQAYEKNKQVKKEIADINQQIFDQKGKVVKLWKETRQWSLDYFEQIYKRLGTKFDRLYFESECTDGVERAKEGLKKGILKESEGAVVFDGGKYGLDTRVFINSQGLPTYEAKELSLALKEFTEFGQLDRLIHVVGPEQRSFFAVTFKVEELMKAKMFKDKQYHKVYGWVNLKKGKVSSRRGQVVTGWWVLDEAKKRIIKSYQSQGVVAEQIAVGAVKYAFLKVQPISEMTFDFDESISLEGNSGPYLQYTFARAQSVLRKNKAPSTKKQTNFKLKLNSEELRLLRSLYKFPEAVKEAAEELAPNKVANFLYDVAQKFNGFYNKHRILDAKNKEQKNMRLFLTQVTARVIKDGLYLLGIEAPEKM